MHHYQAALTTGAELKTWILVVVGNVFAAVLAVRAVGHFMKKDWGEMVTMGVAAVFVGAFIWFPDSVQAMLGGIWGKVSGAA
ncbi:TcpD family membrane protein [Streptomyces sp. H10-C2]|uniref:TcpD family membrane protein n=1 Tax=unclassified Streptomyces TaxID=2593676 RepID=UPI0024BAA22A|nr:MULTISPECIES: TcpD family membrane protein [unclassified Streptomyces]MDJ0345556.1 TcpD family membrane protein [Streptomyces sp. PH10-H1]MDJ0374502.1 TcpD family membrane protein [Streptomyces sp. H10-C2]